MLQSKNKLYTNKFEQHVFQFMREYKLFSSPKGGSAQRLVVAVSGGVDSMALLACLSRIKRFGYSVPLKAVYVNHGTRKAQNDEERLVREYCQKIGCDFQSFKLQGLDVARNFEHEARQARYWGLRQFVRGEDNLVLGHHLDDSFEWSLLQGLRSSNLEGSLGIPVRNREVVRPFMCVSKKQIIKYARALDLPWLEDPTNASFQHERNYLRSLIEGRIQGRYPQYLKHYARRQNELARRLGKHLALKRADQYEMIAGNSHVRVFSFSSEFDPSGLERKILQAMQRLLPHERGSLSQQAQKIAQALGKGKRGPFTLTKGAQVWLDRNHLIVAKPDFKFADQELEQLLAQDFETSFVSVSFEEYRKLLGSILRQADWGRYWPFWIYVLAKRFNMESSKSHELWPALHGESAKRPGELISALKLFRYWGQERNRDKRLSLRLLLPL